jgi:hypothetical protein
MQFTNFRFWLRPIGRVRKTASHRTPKTDPKEPFELRVGIPGKFQIAALDRRTGIDST